VSEVALAKKGVTAAELRELHRRAKVTKFRNNASGREIDENVLRLDISVDLGRGEEEKETDRQTDRDGGESKARESPTLTMCCE
jgi:chromosome condensin MukBEF MukE localization factor